MSFNGNVILKPRRPGRPRKVREIAPPRERLSRDPSARAEALIHREAREAFPGTDLEPFWDVDQWWLRDLADPTRRQWSVEEDEDGPGPFKFVQVA